MRRNGTSRAPGNARGQYGRVATAVRARDGRTWVVRRRWVPRLGHESIWSRFHRRFRSTIRRVGDAADADPGCLEVIGEGVVVALALVVAIAVLVFIVVPFVVAMIDIVLVVLLAALGLAGRVVLRRPWTVEARDDQGRHLTWRVVGWRASGQHVHTVEEMLASGIVPPGATSPTDAAPRRRR